MKPLNLILPVLIVIASIALCYQIVSNSLVNQQNKSDYAELHHVKYGLLSIEEWKRQMATILIDEVNQMYLSRANERKLKKHIEVLLNTLIDKVDKKIREENSDSAGGRVAQSFINIFINLEDIKKGIPDYASAAIAELKKSKTRSQIKAVLNKKLEQFSSQTFDTQDISLLNRILLGTDSKDIASAKAKLKAEIAVKHDLVLKQTIALILLSIVLFSMSGFSQQPLAASRHIFLVIALIVLLIAGVATPTIDMEATISQTGWGAPSAQSSSEKWWLPYLWWGW